LFSALPYLTGWICAIGSSQISDILIQSKLLRRNSVRKIFTAFAMYTPMIATLILAFVDCNNPYLAVALLMIGVGFLGISTGAGFIININEVGGVYSGVLFGVSNTFGTLPGILAPYIVSILTSNVTTS
jgi:ACS family sodium-dependent inorganic phosphate cotransporter-like MFS transporter 5